MSMKVTGVKGIVLGLAVGLGLGVFATFNVPADLRTPSNLCLGILFSGLIGAGAGCLLWWIDRRRKPASSKEWLSAMMNEGKKSNKE
jgi:hypothetical protein